MGCRRLTRPAFSLSFAIDESHLYFKSRGIIGIYHFVSAKHLHWYCNEFGYRYNERDLNGVEKFELAVQQGDNKRLTYNVLIGK